MMARMDSAQRSLHLKAVLALLACSVCWSLGGLLIKLISWEPLAIAGWRAVIVLVFLLLAGVRPKLDRPKEILIGAIAGAFPPIGFIVAMKLTFAANVMVLQYTSPIYVGILGWLFLRERPTIVDWLIIAITLSGMYLVVSGSLGPGDFWGNAIAILNALFLAVQIVALRSLKDYDPMQVFFFAFVFVAIACSPWLTSASFNFSDVSYMLILGCLQQGVPLVLLAFAIKHVRAIETPLITAISPVLTGLWVFIFLGELPGILAIIGSAVVLVAVVVYSIHTTKS